MAQHYYREKKKKLAYGIKLHYNVRIYIRELFDMYEKLRFYILNMVLYKYQRTYTIQ